MKNISKLKNFFQFEFMIEYKDQAFGNSSTAA